MTHEVPGRTLRRRRSGRTGAGRSIKRPVAARRRVTNDMSRGLYGRTACQDRKIVDEALPGGALGDIAAIQLDRSAGCQRGTDFGQRTRIAGEIAIGPSSAVEARMLVSFFSRTTFTSRSASLAFSPMIMPS